MNRSWIARLTQEDSVGKLTLSSGSLALDTGSSLAFTLGAANVAGTDYDTINVLNQLLLNGQQLSDFSFTAGSGFGVGDYTLINALGGVTGSLGATTTGIFDGYDVALVETGSGLNLDVTAAPEPSIVTFLLLGVAGLVGLQVRGRHKATSL